MMIKFIQSQKLFLLTALLLIVAILLFTPLDPDLFWRLKLGQITFQSGPVHFDHLSYTFSGFEFVDFEWFSHLIMYVLYLSKNYYLLSLFFGIIVFMMYWIPTYTVGVKINNTWRYTIITICLISSISIIGIRPQMFTVLGLSILYYLLVRFQITKSSKYTYFIPLVFLVWANLHPGFIVGLVLLSLVVISQFILLILHYLYPDYKDEFKLMNKNMCLSFLAVGVISVIVTLINPYGFNLWIMLYKNSIFFDNYTPNVIVEWFAPDFHKPTGQLMLSYILLSAVIIVKSNKKSLFRVLSALVFGYFALQSVRHFPLFVVVTIPFLVNLKVDIKLNKLLQYPSINLLTSIFCIACAVVLIVKFDIFLKVNSSDINVYRNASYPYDAVNFLKQSPQYAGNMFNNYRWGGFLNWEYSDRKVFISGLMPSWEKQGDRFVKEYRRIDTLTNPEWKERINDYEIRVMLLDLNQPIGNALRTDPEWEEIYIDDIAVVYYRKEK